MDASELAELFQYVDPDFEVLSQKILRGCEGISWGVWFARWPLKAMLMEVHTLTLDHRFKTPQVWKVIESFHGKKISKETAFKILQLRYADTNQSKILKMETTH